MTVSERRTIDDLLAESRTDLERLDPQQTMDAQRAGALVVDIRPIHQRQASGVIAGALQIDRNVLEWRLDPASGGAIPEADLRAHVVIVCQQAYASSLAVSTLRRLGMHRATDLTGGVDAWAEQGLPLKD